MLSGALIWFLLGMLAVVVIVGARLWAQDLGLRMSWWKWVLAAAWYGLLNLSVAVPMTFVGEGEGGAAARLFLLFAVITIILGVGLLRLLFAGRRSRA
ncbi:MAG: hypothetical protein GY906_03640 [bacterium]|nr:hypothetical protein [bacterium]